VYKRSSQLFLLLLILVAGSFLIEGCSTKKNTFLSRSYHNLTAHYNVYWNGMDKLREGKKDFESTVKDNYALVIPVFNYGDKTGAGKMGQYAETAIKKATKTIQKHSMVFNNKEYNKWIDDSYFLMGKAYFYKQDYPMARRTFEFVIKTYNNSPIKYDAMLWQAQANIQAGDFNRAEPVLDMLQGKINQGQAPEKYQKDLELIYANFFILQKNYQPVPDYLNRALNYKLKRSLKTRCLFILAQIYQKNGQLPEASSLYKQVIKRGPTFDMEFNAKINLAQCYESNGGNREYIVEKLSKMLKDDKNKDYQDQIYYSLGMIYLKDADTAEAGKYLKSSVASSRMNNYQKAISALQLADIYFAGKNYPDAQAYYDSTMQFLPKDFPNYKEIQAKTLTLSELVKNLNVIQREDSLVNLSKIPEEKRLQIIDKIIADLLEEEAKKSKEEYERQQNVAILGMNKTGSGGPVGSTTTSGSWYFYNPSTLVNGYGTFIKKWGKRRLEDNWFLSNKVATMEITEETTDSVSMPGDSTVGKSVARSNNPKERKYYLQDIPSTPEQTKASEGKVINAYYNLGFIYIEGLNDYPKSIESFETLLERFPDNKFSAASSYELCQLYKNLDNIPKSDFYRNQVLTNFPETDFAKLIVNPDFYKEMQSKAAEIGVLYEDTYNAFYNQQYYIVINNSQQAAAKYPNDTAMLPRFEYLRALSLGKIEVVDSLVSAMQNIVNKYPKSPVKPMAQNVLTMLGKQKNSSGQPILSDTTNIMSPVEKLYTYDPQSVHFYVLIVNNTKTNVDALKIKISDFDIKNHEAQNLQVNSLLLDNNIEMITVGNFDESYLAVTYYTEISLSNYIFNKLASEGDYYSFLISVENYPILFKNKDIKQYMRFFEKNYPVKKI
jgi:tetratricopeptide (TPR) repeat protein